MSTYRLILVFPAFILSMLFVSRAAAQAKTYDEEVTVVAPFDPIVPDAFKISQNPVADDTATKVPIMNYDITPRIANVLPVIEPLPAVKLLAEPISKLYRNYLRAGVGNYSAFYGELFMNSLRSKQQMTTFHLKHQSAAGTLNDAGPTTNSRNEVDLTATKYLSEHTFTSKAFYYRDGLHLYGYKPGDYQDTVIKKDDIKQHYNKVGVATSFMSNYKSLDKLNHSLGLSFYHLAGFYQNTENNVAITASLNKKVNLIEIGKNQMLGANASYTFLNQHDSLGHINSGLLLLQPFIKAEVNEYSLMAGFKVNIASDTVTNGHIYPVAEAKLELIPNALKLYAGMDGGIERMSLNGAISENLFVSSVLPWKYVNDKFHIYGGLQSNISRSFNFNASISSSTYSNYPLFVTDTNAYLLNSFTLRYDNVSVLQIKAELEFIKTSHLRLALNGSYFHYKTDQQPYAWYKPDYVFEFNGRYDIQNKLAFTAKMLVNGPVWALKPIRNQASNEIKKPIHLEAFKLDGWADISLGTEYAFSKALSFWLTMNNLANSRYYQWYNYRTYGLNILGGVSYSF